jgi:hypothetical protein
MMKEKKKLVFLCAVAAFAAGETAYHPLCGSEKTLKKRFSCLTYSIGYTMI